MADFIEEEDDQAAAEETDAEKKILIVSGCLSQRYGSELFDEMPEVDIFLGVNDYEKTASDREEFQTGAKAKLFSCQPEKFMEFSERKTEANPYTATLRIAEGCNNCCAYCVIPQIRGKYRSRPMENILQEAEELASKGCREVILIAQGCDGVRQRSLRRTYAG